MAPEPNFAGFRSSIDLRNAKYKATTLPTSSQQVPMSFTTTVVDTIPLLQQCIADITPTVPHILSVDLEGIDLHRNGKICIMQLKCSTSTIVWLIDVTVLGAGAFEEKDERDISLRTVLEGETQKVIILSLA
jgi:hypothetical protein